MAEISRRRFAALVGLSASATLLPRPAEPVERWGLDPRPLRAPPAHPDEQFWVEVRARFPLPPDFAFVNAANLCPTPLPVLEALERNTRALDADPSSASRARLTEGREESRRRLAELLGVTPEEIVITRNTSEANNFVSSGLDLRSGDEVVVFSDNHPSNLAAWTEKAKRFGFTVVSIPVSSPHPGAQHYLDAAEAALSPRTRVMAFTHVTNTVGDCFPAEELCALARSRGVLSLVDGAQSFGVLDVKLGRMRPDFYTGSAHKWLCGPKELGVLYVNRDVHDRISPSVVSLYPGAAGISRRLEGLGQRDEAALAALGEAVRFQSGIGQPVIERRALELTRMLADGLKELKGVTLWTHSEVGRSAAVVTLKPGTLDPRRLASALYEKDRIACTARSGSDRPGIRFSPHLYNTQAEMHRIVTAVGRYLETGL